MLTCIFLAGKVEECRLNLRSLIESVNVGNEADILAYELKLIEALDFDVEHAAEAEIEGRGHQGDGRLHQGIRSQREHQPERSCHRRLGQPRG